MSCALGFEDWEQMTVLVTTIWIMNPITDTSLFSRARASACGPDYEQIGSFHLWLKLGDRNT
jgi:hypothetical protein